MTSATATPTDLLAQVAESTARFDAAIGALTAAELAAPSRLPGWTRGHVIAHMARNADSLLNLLLWARTGIEIPQYASVELRDADIEAGAGRPLAVQHADFTGSAHRWQAVAATMPAADWQAVVRNRQGGSLTADLIPWMRLRETEIHHVDLGVAYTPADWPTPFVARLLPEAIADLSAKLVPDATPTFDIQATDTDFIATVGPGRPHHTVLGPASALLAWLLGRSPGADLTGPLPPLPAWK
ncbi:maleylpyruvate isomerase [Nocardia neocaledoniensis NBRC 108232]|uniref:Maleylpyruvate isomerase n=1 Tax=Nocardia neocaledoniensis TaxID=236511 RepID=A0A317NNA9_9NOCA|nr:maleylpyruvate isomerase family mycothiol-dependent enzyme [Nocardia neocaledoniensis]PWV76525.1 maleylpyruvate isomerase [Nocardia neocaledoniensis]GEM29347.1 maleylpyruvate isomerase [Nocardia neocaledoniensis NBRC 108232]